MKGYIIEQREKMSENIPPYNPTLREKFLSCVHHVAKGLEDPFGLNPILIKEIFGVAAMSGAAVGLVTGVVDALAGAGPVTATAFGTVAALTVSTTSVFTSFLVGDVVRETKVYDAEITLKNRNLWVGVGSALYVSLTTASVFVSSEFAPPLEEKLNNIVNSVTSKVSTQASFDLKAK